MLPPPVVVVVEVEVGEVTLVVEVEVGEVVDVEVEVGDVLDVVVPSHGQFKSTACPTAFFRQRRASLAVVTPSPFVLQMHAGEQVSEPTAARKMYRQSLASGPAPVVTGCEQRAPPESVVVVDDDVDVDVFVVDVDVFVVDVEVFVVEVDVSVVEVVDVDGSVVDVVSVVVEVVLSTVVVVPLVSHPGFSGSTKSTRSAGGLFVSS
jgi:hypothetical protein